MGGKSKTVTKKMLVRELEIHPLAQREIVGSNLKRVKAAFNPELIGSIDVVQYEHRGKFRTLVIDGQHRVRAMMDLGFGDYAVDVLIHTAVTNDEQACEFFLGKDQRSSIRPYDKFVIEGRAGHPDVLGIYEIAKGVGVAISATKTTATVCAVTSLKSIYRLDSGTTLRKTLETVATAWGKKAASFDGKLLEGVGYLYHRFNGQIDESSMIEQLARFPGGPNAIVGEAKALMTHIKGNSAKSIAIVIANHYNARKRTNKLELSMTAFQWIANDPPRRSFVTERDADGYICQLCKRWVAPGGLNPRSCTWTGRGATEADAEAAACAKAEHRLRNSRMDAPPLATCLGLRHQGRRS